MELPAVDYVDTGLSLFNGTQKDLEAYQNEKYSSLLHYAYSHVPYYHRIFEEIGLFKNGNLVEEKICDIPVLTREILRNEYENFKSDEFDSLSPKAHSSSGSSGTPLTVYHCKNQEYCGKEDKLLFGALNGRKPGDFWIKLWGNESDLLGGKMLKEGPKNLRYNNRIILDAFHQTEEKLKSFIGEINQRKPAMIWAYVDPIFQLSRYIIKNKIEIYNPVCILTTGSMLFKAVKTEIQKAFPNSKVANQYGCSEAGTLASEVNGKDGLRIFEHSVKLEILHEDGSISSEGSGEILVTSLNNHAMPLIRYKIGDRGSITRKIEGLEGSFSLITDLHGKTNAHIKKANGELVFGQFFCDLFCAQEWVERFLIIQTAPNDLEIHIKIRSGYSKDETALENILKTIDRELGLCHYDIIYDDVALPKSGKLEYLRPYSESASQTPAS